MPAGDTIKSAEHPAAGEPIIVDMGRKGRKQVKQLREGRGKLLTEVTDLLQELRTAGSISATAQPVVIVVREKRRVRSLMWPLD